MKQQKKKPGKAPKKARRPVLFVAVGVCAAGILLVLALRTPKQLELPYLTAGYIAVMDQDTGRLVYDKESDTPRSPASLTKLMTLFLVLDDVESGRLSFDDTYRVTPAEANTPGSKYGIQVGETLTVEQLIAGTALCSGCDCVQCLVKLSAGDEASFVVRMNEKAEKLGLKGSHFANATGIDAANHYMTAGDLAKLVRALLSAHPELLDFTQNPTMEIGGKTFQNMHRLVGRDARIKGLKTGTTRIGGFNLVSYAEEDGKRYIIVLLDSNNDNIRFTETETVVDALFGVA